MPTLQQNKRTNSEKTKKTKRTSLSANAQRCREKFLRFFPKGFYDPKYISWERGYKWNAHEQWEETLSRTVFRALLQTEKFPEICARAIRIESRTNLLFSFEKMALRDAVKQPEGARMFAEGLYEFLHGRAKIETRFNRWCATLAALPRKGRRVLTHPVATVFGFIAQPETHIFLKPMVTRAAAREYGFELYYNSRPSWETYASMLEFAETISRDLSDLKPRDMMDIQSFMWVLGSSEYA
jgi:hypothetical protein